MKLIYFSLILIFGAFAYFVVRLTNEQINDIRSHGASENVIEAESGVLSGNVTTQSDISASGGQYILFGTLSDSPTPTGIVQTNLPSLVSAYYYPEAFRASNTGYYNSMKYRPRSFVAGNQTGDKIQWNGQLVSAVDRKRFSGWDILNLPNNGVFTKYAGDDLTTLTLNRPAEIAVAWISNTYIPTWLSTWTQADTITLNTGTVKVYTKKFPAGDVKIGGLFNSGNVTAGPIDLPIVLIGEQDGTATKEPIVPTGLTKPIANQPCPSWVHDQYKTVGPDGQTYATWHPQIDPVFWCYFGHDHGANPDNFVKGYKVAYNYVATRHGMSEGHNGFKTFVFDDSGGHTWLTTVHFGTGSLARVCTRFHTVDVAVRNTGSTEILADIHFMSDFGQAVEHNTSNLIQPPACPTQGNDVGTRGDGIGQRQIPVHTDGVDGYEPWVVGAKGNVLGFKAGWHYNTHDSQVICDTLTCTNPYTTGTSGSRRFIADMTLLGIVAGTNTNTFYTDPMGTMLMTAADPTSVKQYVKPGISIMDPDAGITCIPYKGWGQKEVCLPSTEANQKMETYNRENSLQVPN